MVGREWSDKNQKWQDIVKFTNKDVTFMRDQYGNIIEPTQIACGKCIECKLKHAQEWADRIMLECQNSPGKNYMITLTYNEENLPLKKGINLKTGEVITTPTLRKEDLQLFNKKLKRHWEYHYGAGKNIRFFAAGEYGDKYERPHYHVIYFNIDIKDLKPHHYNKKGYIQYKSEEIEKIWGNGLTTIEAVNYEVAEYVARYLLKKQKGEKTYEEQGKQEEFNMMSTRPGIGYNYYNKKGGEKIYETQKIWLPQAQKIRQARPPRYFDKLLERENPERLEEVKQARKELAELKEIVLKQQLGGLSTIEYNWNREKTLERKTKQLNRPFENETV